MVVVAIQPLHYLNTKINKNRGLLGESSLPWKVFCSPHKSRHEKTADNNIVMLTEKLQPCTVAKEVCTRKKHNGTDGASSLQARRNLKDIIKDFIRKHGNNS